MVDVGDRGGGTAFITAQENVERGLAGETGTRVVAWRRVRGEAGRG
jgi:carbamate kinase